MVVKSRAVVQFSANGVVSPEAVLPLSPTQEGVKSAKLKSSRYHISNSRIHTVPPTHTHNVEKV